VSPGGHWLSRFDQCQSPGGRCHLPGRHYQSPGEAEIAENNGFYAGFTHRRRGIHQVGEDVRSLKLIFPATAIEGRSIKVKDASPRLLKKKMSFASNSSRFLVATQRAD
jgi:hypothetical protein